MAAIPHAPLSEALQARLEGYRLVSAVFLTYKFDPAFFEQEVLPVLFDMPLSHAAPIRLVQLEDALRDLASDIAVYYDVKGLVTMGSGSAKLDVRRIPLVHSTGIFHPKNIFLLLESEKPRDDGTKPMTLLVACLSANLTRAGWWENVEVCHFEEIAEASKTPLKDDLVAFLARLKRRTRVANTEQRALDDVLRFLRKTFQHPISQARPSASARFYGGGQALPDFLAEASGGRLQGTNLEILSPYFDDADTCAPLAVLIERFKPKSVRVMLPRDDAGQVTCRETLFKHIKELKNVSWGKLPPECTRAGTGDNISPRFVHAKVYRFFTRHPASEILFVGSANLTSPAHQKTGNEESGFLIELPRRGAPDFWLELETRDPTVFAVRTEDDNGKETAPSPLALRYNWEAHRAEALWLANGTPPVLRLEARSVAIGELRGLKAQSWTRLSGRIADCLRETLTETSLVHVLRVGSDPTVVLVQEEGMAQKPSLLLQLSVADILRYWTMLSPSQRAAYLATKCQQTIHTDEGADLVPRSTIKYPQDTLFDRFAGIFHAFDSLRKNCQDALAEGREKEATYRLFGQKYDSLPTLVRHLLEGQGGDDIERYVIVQCAVQLIGEIRVEFPGFWSANQRRANALVRSVKKSTDVLSRKLVAHEPTTMGPFLKWFETWFIERAQPVEAEND